MAVSVAPASSTLNPNAPLFVPAAYLAAEDFSPEWWMLIKTPAFRDYWLRERAHTLVDAQDESFDDIDIQFEHLNVSDETDQMLGMDDFDALDWETDLDAVYSAGQWAEHGSEEGKRTIHWFVQQ